MSDIITTKAKNKGGNDQGKLGKGWTVIEATVWMSSQGGTSKGDSWAEIWNKET